MLLFLRCTAKISQGQLNFLSAPERCHHDLQRFELYCLEYCLSTLEAEENRKKQWVQNQFQNEWLIFQGHCQDIVLQFLWHSEQNNERFVKRNGFSPHERSSMYRNPESVANGGGILQNSGICPLLESWIHWPRTKKARMGHEVPGVVAVLSEWVQCCIAHLNIINRKCAI